MSQFTEQIRDELVRAANEAFAAPSDPSSLPGQARRALSWRGVRGSRRATVVIVLAVFFALAGAGAVAAVTGLWSPVGAWRGLPRGVLTTTAPPSNSLQSILGVLRRPQNAADRDPLVVGLSAVAPPGYRGTIELSGVRLATRLASGVEVYLVPELVPPNERRYTGFAEGLGVVLTIRGHPSGGVCCEDAAHIQTIGRGTILSEAPRGATTTGIVVPDGVARVRFIYGRYSGPGRPVYPTPLTLDVPVQGNVAAATTSARGAEGLQPLEVTWYGADGRTIKSFTNPHLPRNPYAAVP